MKRIICFLLLIVFSLTLTCTAAVDFDVSKYNSKELGEIYSIISQKLFDYIIVPQGYYVVGEDLPAGRYTILKNSDLPNDAEFSWVALFNSTDDYKNEISHWSWDDDGSKCVTWINTLWNSLTYDLTDGMVIAVGFGTAGIRKVQTSIFSSFWN